MASLHRETLETDAADKKFLLWHCSSTAQSKKVFFGIGRLLSNLFPPTF